MCVCVWGGGGTPSGSPVTGGAWNCGGLASPDDVDRSYQSSGPHPPHIITAYDLDHVNRSRWVKLEELPRAAFHTGSDNDAGPNVHLPRDQLRPVWDVLDVAPYGAMPKTAPKIGIRPGLQDGAPPDWT